MARNRKPPANMNKASLDAAMSSLENLKENYLEDGDYVHTDTVNGGKSRNQRIEEVMAELASAGATSSRSKKPLSKKASAKSRERKTPTTSAGGIDHLLKKPGVIPHRTLEKFNVRITIRNKGFDKNQPYRLVRAGRGRLFVQQDDLTIEIEKSGNGFKEKAQPRAPKKKALDDQLAAIEALVNEKEDFSEADANHFIRTFDADFAQKYSNIDFSQKIQMSRQGDLFYLEQGGQKAAFKYSGRKKFREVRPPKPPKPPRAPKAVSAPVVPTPTVSPAPAAPVTSSAPQSSKSSTQKRSKQGSASRQATPKFQARRPPPNLKPEALPLQQLSQLLKNQTDLRRLYEIALDEFHKRQDDLPILLNGGTPNYILDSFESFLEDILISARNADTTSEVAVQSERLNKIATDLLETAKKDIKNPIELQHLGELIDLVHITLKLDSGLRSGLRGKVKKALSRIDYGGIVVAMSGGNPLVAGAVRAFGAAKDFIASFADDAGNTNKDRVFEQDREKLKDRQRQSRRRLIDKAYSSSGPSLKSPQGPIPSFAKGMEDFLSQPIGPENLRTGPGGTSGADASSILSGILSELQVHTQLLQNMLSHDRQWATLDATQRGRSGLAAAEAMRDSMRSPVGAPGPVTPSAAGGMFGAMMSGGAPASGGDSGSSFSAKDAALLALSGERLLPRIFRGAMAGLRWGGSKALGFGKFLGNRALPLAQTALIGSSLWNNERNAIGYGSSRTAAGLTDTAFSLAKPLSIFGDWLNVDKHFNRKNVAGTLDQIANNPLAMIKAAHGAANKNDFANFEKTRREKRTSALKALIEKEKEVYKRAQNYEKETGMPGFGVSPMTALTSDAITASADRQMEKIRRLTIELLEMEKKEKDKARSLNLIIGNNSSGRSSSQLLKPSPRSSQPASSRQPMSIKRNKNGALVPSMTQAIPMPQSVGGVALRAGDAGVTPELVEWVKKYSEMFDFDPNIAMEVIRQESSFNPNAVSPTGPRGYMQLSKAVANDMGVNRDIPEENIKGGIGHLAKLYRENNYDLARTMTAYHQGQAGANRIGNDYRNNKHTAIYVPRVLKGVEERRAIALKKMNADNAQMKLTGNGGGSPTIINAPQTNVASGGSSNRGGAVPSTRGAESVYSNLQANSLRGVPVA